MNASRWAAIRSVALLGRTCSRFCVVPEALFLTTTIAHAVQTLAVYTVATCEVFDKTKNRASAERDSARSCCRSPIGTTLISCIGQSTVQRQDTGAVVEPVTPQTNTKRRVRVRIRYFTYRSFAKKEIRAQNGKNQAQGKIALAGIHARFAQAVSQAILNRSTLSSRLLALAASSQSIGIVPSCYAAQHRVATDAPVGTFKIRPILVKACAIYPAPRLQGRG